MASSVRVILASASPRRRELLARIAYPFEVVPADIDERRLEDEDPETHVRRLAAEKARRVSLDHPDALVVAADTVVVLGEEILGKPESPERAAAMLARLSGRRHLVLTGVACARGGAVARELLSRSEVSFRPIGDGEVDAYVASGEPMDKAGAYAIQGGAGRFVRGVAGSVTGVIGLPLEETLAATRELGVSEPEGALPLEAVMLRYRAVAGEIAALAVAHGRSPESVRLVAVSKGHPAAMARAAIDAGATDLGENYVQAAEAQRSALGDTTGVRWHMIGPLQRNKARLASRLFDVVHTIDKLETAQALANPAGGTILGLVQVNVMRDPAKRGIMPEALSDLVASLEQLEGFSLTGLMTIGRAEATQEATADGFAELRSLAERLREAGHEGVRELSMGMSEDYDAAVAEGATLVRLGTAVFGPREPNPRGG